MVFMDRSDRSMILPFVCTGAESAGLPHGSKEMPPLIAPGTRQAVMKTPKNGRFGLDSDWGRTQHPQKPSERKDLGPMNIPTETDAAEVR